MRTIEKIRINMKKIFTTLLTIFVLTQISQAQTYKKVVTQKDTLLVTTQTATTIDTMSRKTIKEKIEKLKADKQVRQESIKILQSNIDYYNAEIDRLRLLLKKTD